MKLPGFLFKKTKLTLLGSLALYLLTIGHLAFATFFLVGHRGFESAVVTVY